VVVRIVVLISVTALLVATPMVVRGATLHPGAKALFSILQQVRRACRQRRYPP
jgi:hypothetical protein